MKGDVPSRLGARELEALRLVSQGCTYRGAAKKMRTAWWTVRNQMAVVRYKLRAHSNPHAVAIAKDRGII